LRAGHEHVRLLKHQLRLLTDQISNLTKDGWAQAERIKRLTKEDQGQAKQINGLAKGVQDQARMIVKQHHDIENLKRQLGQGR
jgi:hypothetical protein